MAETSQAGHRNRDIGCARTDAVQRADVRHHSADLHLAGETRTSASPSPTSRIRAVAQFRQHYSDASITKEDIFHYIYALLHHPGYRERYAANLKRELPRIPFAPDFGAFAKQARNWPGCMSNTNRSSRGRSRRS